MEETNVFKLGSEIRVTEDVIFLVLKYTDER